MRITDRNLSISERSSFMRKYNAQPLDLMQFINTKYHEPFIHERIEFEGSLDPIRLMESLDTLIQVFPILRCSYNSRDNSFIERKLTGKSLLRTEDHTDRDKRLTESLDMSEKLIQFSLSENTLYITVSHLVCDGAGFKQLIYLLCDIYNGSFDEDCGYLMNRDFSQLTKHLAGGTGTFQMLLSMMKNYKNRSVYSQGRSAGYTDWIRSIFHARWI